MTIVAVLASKGGVAKSTSTVVLTQEAIARGLDAILVDLDPQGSAARWAGVNIAIPLPTASSPEEVIAAVGDHALAFCDTPPGADKRTLAAIRAADACLIPSGLSPVDIEGTLDVVRMVEPDLVVPVRLDRRRAIHAHGLDYLRTRFGGRVTVPVPSATAVEWAQANREPLPPLSRPAIAYRAVLDRVLQLATLG